jgi:copper transport protein
VALVVGLLAVAAASGVAGAHATLVSADPPDGARLDRSPAKVTLTFDEHVSATLGAVRVVDTSGQRVDRGAVRVDGGVVSVDLAPRLPAGSYVVSYRVISADSHPVRGALVFGVGSGRVDESAARRVAGSGDDQRWRWVGGVARAVAYGGSLLAAGGALFLVLVDRDGEERRGLVRGIRAAALVGALGGIAALPVQAALGTGEGVGSLFENGVFGHVVADGVGLALVLCLVGLAVLAVAVRADRTRWVAAAGAVLAAVSFAATGHDRAGDLVALTTLADAVHLLVVAVWAGGLTALLVAVRHRRAAAQPRGDTPVMVLRFSSLATVTVVGAGITGGFLAWREVRTLHQLTTSGYGRVLLAKIGVVAVVALLGAYNHYRLMPALRQGKTRAVLRQLVRTLGAEVLGLVVVVGLTAAVVSMVPGATLAQGGPVEKIVELPHVGSVQLVVAPAKAGFNEIHIYTFDLDHRPEQIAQTLTLRLELPSAQVGPLDREAARAGPAHFQLNGNDLSLGGTWTITVLVKVDQFTQVQGSTQVKVAA